MSSPSPSFDVPQLIADLGRVTLQFKAWLETRPKIDLLDEITIKNHLALLHMCFGKWKAQQKGRFSRER
jgi:hypothetical protein